MTNKNILGFGTDKSSSAKPIGITGNENNELKTISLEDTVLYQKILQELKKFNMYLENITNTKLTYKDAESYKKER